MNQPTHQDQLKKFNELIKDLKFTMFTTLDSGIIRSRPMATHVEQNIEQGLFFLTRDDAPKISEIKHDERVNLSFSNPDNQTYVSISGVANISKDKDKIKEIWNPLYRAWFPDGVNDPHICLITVIPESAEYWESPNSFISQSIAFVKRVTTGKIDNIGEHEKVNLKDVSPI